MRHLVIGTAGHVDHGKTALVHALTGVMTDRLPEEQRRGITIELGFAPWRIGDDLLVSIIDAPGHRRLVHHMIAGASGIDIVLLVVAADEGVMPQTREHVAACKLLGLRRAVVAITKLDRADRELAELAAEEARELLTREGIANEAVLCSSKTGEGVELVAEAMRRAIEQTGEVERRGDRVRLAVDRVFTVKGAGTVVTGTLVSGAISVGARLRVLGAERESATTARTLHVHGQRREQVAAPTRLAINLGGLSLDQVRRGDVVTDDPQARPSRVLDVWLQLVEPVRRGAEASIHLGTARSTARLQPAERTDRLEEGGPARLRLTAPLVVVGGDRFVLRGAQIDGPAGAVLGGGVVLDAHPPRRVRAAKRIELLATLEHGDASEAARLLAHECGPRPLPIAALPSRFAIAGPTIERAAEALAANGTLVAIAKHGWIANAAFEALSARALELVGEHHRGAPLEPGLKLQTLREQLAAVAGEHAGAAALAGLTTGPKPTLVLEGEHVRLRSFRGAVDDEQASRALEAVRRLLDARALSGLGAHALGEELEVDVKQVRALLAAVVREGAAVHAGELWFATTAVQALAGQLRAHFAQHERLTIKQFKEITGLGRKQTIPLLEHFDRVGETRRQGSDRTSGR